MPFCSNVDGTGECDAKLNKSYRERQIPYVFTLMWTLRNLKEDHGGRGGGKKREGGSQTIRDLKTENKLRVDGGVVRRGKWVMVLRRAPVGMSTGCCMETNLSINFI